MIPSAWLDLAVRRLSGQVMQTPLTYDPDLNLYLKWENRQLAGSFKIRGALNKVLSLGQWELDHGLVTASAGNHGQGVALAGKQVGARVVVFSSENIPQVKAEAMRAMGAELHLTPGGYAAAEQTAKEYAVQQGMTWISPYNDGQVIAGQATLAVEFLEQMAPQLPAWVMVPLGGGGLAAGVAAALENIHPHPRVFGVQSTASPYFYHLFHDGNQAKVVEQESLADGLAGAVEEESLTIPLVRRLLNDVILVEESEIAAAIAYAWREYHEVIEGAAAAALAAALNPQLRNLLELTGSGVVVLSGGNIQPELHAQICKENRLGAA